ncbi:hypothetical protein [Pseudomonas sp. nanlin1]|uniref:hypothetical protein n=1 Tax=Pseudomonas sp. nanlin1 TaxID=3040605 RepID=UPI00388DEA07
MTAAALSKQAEQRPTFDEPTASVIGVGLPFNEVLGYPRHLRVADLPHRLAATMQGDRIEVRLRS